MDRRLLSAIISCVVLIGLGALFSPRGESQDNQRQVTDYLMPQDIPHSNIVNRNVDLVVDTAQNNSIIPESLNEVMAGQGITQAANVSYILEDDAFIDVRTYILENTTDVLAMYEANLNTLRNESIRYQENFAIGDNSIFAESDAGYTFRFYEDDMFIVINVIGREGTAIDFTRVYRDWLQAELK